MCLTCSENATQVTCPTCRKLTASGFPLDQNATFDQVWSYMTERFKEEWLMLSAGVLLMGVVGAVGGIFNNIITEIVKAVLSIKLDPVNPLRNLGDFIKVTGISQVIGIFVQIPFQGIGLLGMYRLIFDVLHGRKADLGRMFKNLNLLGRYVVLQLLIHAVVTLPMFAVLGIFGYVGLRSAGLTISGLNSHSMEQLMRSPAPFIFFAAWAIVMALSILVLPISMLSVPELMASECEPMEALQRAWKLGEGQRLRLFGYSLLSALVILAGMLACCVGAIPASAAAYMLLLALFLVIRKAHADLPPVLDKP